MPSAPSGVPRVALSDEQLEVMTAVAEGHDVIVDCTVGSGKTTVIQQLCVDNSARGRSILYLTYSRMLKADALERVGGAKVQNFHGIVYPHLLRLGIEAGLGESVAVFNAHFDQISAGFERYDMLIVDEYQDLNTDYAQLLTNIKSCNPRMQVVMVGDTDQKVRADTTLDAHAFARQFCASPVLLGFTRSFRIGPQLGELLGTAWGKTIVGVNTEQRVEVLDHQQAIELIAATEPGDLLCLGKYNGPMLHALNEAERLAPQRYNKQTVFASIRDGDSDVRPREGVAVFTTYDASKGMERPVCLIFDYRMDNWRVRNNFPGADPEVLRNVFLVAASRGKGRIVFVRSGTMRNEELPTGPAIGPIPVETFVELPGVTRPQYSRPFAVSKAFDFTYAEDVAAAMALVTRRRVRPAGEAIEIARADGMIDLSPAVGMYQEAVFFDDYNALGQAMMMSSTSYLAESLMGAIAEGEHWHNALVLVAIATGQQRYAEQVSTVPDEASVTALLARLGSQLSPASPSQLPLSVSGVAYAGRAAQSPIAFTGIADTLEGEWLYELKFTGALDHPMFLQAALYAVMARARGMAVRGTRLWNTRTDEMWEVEVADPDRFWHAVIACVTKQAYSAFGELDPFGE